MAFEENLSSVFLRCFINQRWICQGLWDLHDRHLFYRNYRGYPGRTTSSRAPCHQVSHSSPTLVMISHLSQAHLLPLLSTHPHPHSLLFPASSGLLYPSILPRFGSFLQKKKSTTKSFSGKSYLEKGKYLSLALPAIFLSLYSFLSIFHMRSQCHSLQSPVFILPLSCSSMTNPDSLDCCLWDGSNIISLWFCHYF